MIEDEPGLVLTIGDRLETEGYKFESCSTGPEGERLAMTGDYSVIILDVMLPGKDGFSVCRSLREAGIQTQVLMLTARSQLDDKVSGLSLGADDYMTKPFEIRELLVRIEALRRRAEMKHKGEEKTQYDCDVCINLTRGLIINSGMEYPLSALEIKLLTYVAQHKDQIISREELLSSVWGYDMGMTTRTIDVHIARLRRKLGDSKNGKRFVFTIRGAGYRFSLPHLI